MKPTELRIGNLLQDENSIIMKVVGLCDFKVLRTPPVVLQALLTEELKEIGVTPGDPRPIPLTEGWLLKFGFFNDNRNGWRLDDMYSLSFSITNDGEFYPCWQDRVLSKVVTKYVHQVQNLYFALTGDELRVGTK
jgi:hypothetical protein